MCGRQHPPGWGECARGSDPPIWPCPQHGTGVSPASTLSVMTAAVRGTATRAAVTAVTRSESAGAGSPRRRSDRPVTLPSRALGALDAPEPPILRGCGLQGQAGQRPYISGSSACASRSGPYRFRPCGIGNLYLCSVPSTNDLTVLRIRCCSLGWLVITHRWRRQGGGSRWCGFRQSGRRCQRGAEGTLLDHGPWAPEG